MINFPESLCGKLTKDDYRYIFIIKPEKYEPLKASVKRAVKEVFQQQEPGSKIKSISVEIYWTKIVAYVWFNRGDKSYYLDVKLSKPLYGLGKRLSDQECYDMIVGGSRFAEYKLSVLSVSERRSGEFQLSEDI